MEKYLYLLAGLLLTGLTGCEEEPPNIQLEPSAVELFDTSYIAGQDTTTQLKMVLIEDYTGVRCSNCPTAAEKIKKIKTKYPGRVHSLAIHVEPQWSTPYKESIHDFRTEEGQELYYFIGKVALPTGNVDRNFFNGENGINVSYNLWDQYAQERLALSSPANITINTKYDEKNDYYVIRTKVHFTEALQGDIYLTVAVAEDDIYDLQSMPDEKIKTDYHHQHVLRKIFTSYNGDKIVNNPPKNQVIIKDFILKFNESNEKWVKENLEVIAFIHRFPNTKEVLQAQRTDF